MPTFDSPDAVFAAAQAGEPALIIDNDSPDAEGDLFVAASVATVSSIAFLIRHGCGYLRAAVTKTTIRRLRIPPMLSDYHDNTGWTMPPYLVSVDASYGTTTGISAADRARTVRVLADPHATPDSLSRPGHVVVSEAYHAGSRRPQGATGTAVEIASAAGLSPAGAPCGLVSETDETRMATRAELHAFADRHKLPLLSSNGADVHFAGQAFQQRRRERTAPAHPA